VLKRPGTDLIALPGTEHADFECYTLHVIADIATRLAPWATWYCSPDAIDGADIGPETYGMCFGTCDVVWLRTSRHPNEAIEAAFHEAYHSCERWMTGDEINALRIASERGPWIERRSAYNEYWCQGHEVRARAFASWANSAWLMGVEPKYRWRMPRHERLWTAIYRGDMAMRAARAGRIRRELMPTSLRQRMAERTDSQVAFDAARRFAKAAWEWVADAFRPDMGVQTAPSKRLTK
jgi:hypothetical protein